MQCVKCGGTYVETSDLLELDDPYVGKISIIGKPYFKCVQCDDILFTLEMAQAIELERNNRKKEFINHFPISDFISSSETASLLGISRQALHKNRRIRRGFIYQTTVDRVTFYLKQSVIQFKKTGDGRFPLYPEVVVQYLEATTPLQFKTLYERQPKKAASTQEAFYRAFDFVNTETENYSYVN